MTNGEQTQGLEEELLTNAPAWRHWLEYLSMRAREDGDETALARYEGEMNMLSIIHELASKARDEAEERARILRAKEALVEVGQRFLDSEDTFVHLDEHRLILDGELVLEPSEYEALCAMSWPDA